jgi:protein involved in polysaccharide export with SLBB domain
MTREKRLCQQMRARSRFTSRLGERSLLWIVAGALSLSAAGCGSPVNVQPLSPADIPMLQAAANFPHEKYMIVPDDTLRINYTFHPEMKQEVLVQPDGKITANLAGEVLAAGMTTVELERYLADKTSEFLRNPEVVVSIARFAERFVYVGGEVRKSGQIPYRKGLTPVQAIIAAGGLLDSARSDSVVLMRPGDSGIDFVSRKFNIDDTVLQGEKEPLFLAPYDVVYVPRSSIAEANLWVKQYITDLFPFLKGSAGINYRPAP